MAPPSAKYRALQQIATLLNSSSPPGEPIEAVLGLARKTLGAQSISLLRMEQEASRLTTWTAADGKCGGLTAEAERCALAALDGQTSAECPRTFAAATDIIPGKERAAIVSEGAKDRDEEFLQAVLSQIALALAARQERDAADQALLRAEKRLAEVATIYEIGRAIDEVDLDRLLEMITAKATAVMDADACSLMLRDEKSDEFVIRASFGLPDDIVRGARIGYGEGIAGRVAATGEPMLLVDVAADPRFSEGGVTPRADIASSLCVPLKESDGRVGGVLSIRRHKPSPPFTESDLRLFSIFASQAALAISNTELYGRLQKQLQEMATVSELVRATNSTLDLNAVLSMIADSIVNVVGFERCCVYLLDPRTEELVAGVRRGYEDAQLEEHIRVGEGIIGMAAKEQIPVFGEQSSSGSPMLAAPILVRGACIGVVVVDNNPSGRPVQQANVALLSTFVNQAGIAVENARLYEAMEEKYAELNMLYEHGRAISSAYGVDRAAEMLMEAANRAAHADGGMLLLLNERRTELTVRACSGCCLDYRDKVQAAALDLDAARDIRSMLGPVILSADDGDAEGKYRVLRSLLPQDWTILMAPLVSENAALGALVLARKDGAELQAGEVKLVSIITSHAAAIIGNAMRYENRMERKVLELSALHEFSARISSAPSLEDALDSILAVVSEVVECDESYIYAIDQERGVLTPKAARLAGGTPKQLPEEPIEGDAVMSWAIRERKALVVPDVSTDSRFDQAGLGERPVRSLMSIPLMVQDEVVAVLSVHSYRPNLYSEDDVRVPSIIASQGAAIYKELEALSALTNYTDNILSSIAAGVTTLDCDGVVLTWNKAAEAITRLPSHEVVGLPISEVINRLKIDAADKANTEAMIARVYRTGEVFHGYKQCFHPENKEAMYLNMSISPLINSAGEQLGLVIIFEDVTREMKMEEEFRKMGELAAVGQLAASIAHELRNPLSSIRGAAQLLREQYEDHPTIIEFLDIILEEVDALAKLTTEFLDFARPIQFELKTLDINNVVQKTLQLMSVPITQSRTRVIENLASDIPTIEGDEKQIEQVLRNIILNALQAMPGGGDLEISTEPHNGAAGGIVLSVRDTGQGIAPDKIDRIFVPFFTTKTKGTGLGLSVVQKIVDNHGGRIEVTSEEGVGTTFRIILPERAAVPLAPIEEGPDGRRDSAHIAAGPEHEE